jgi:zinc/manganese transport system permease protein
MLEYDFMQTAFAAGLVVALVAGAVGYFLVLRNLTFAGHALSHVGFAGATGALLVGIPPFWGLLALTLAASAAMGLLGERLRGRDVAVGIILSMSLGLGVLFLSLYTSYATQATALLFGNVLGVSRDNLLSLVVLAGLSLAALAAIARPLLFATLDPELAEAKGLSLRLISVLFLLITGVAVAEAVQVVGILLVFTLMVGPAATAQRLTPRLGVGVVLAILLAITETWVGIALAYVSDWPPTFWITALSSAAYLLSLLMSQPTGQPAPRPAGAATPEAAERARLTP